jgi:hypothetical protein
VIEVFKTNIVCQCVARKVELLLAERFPDFKINFDLEDCDRILRIEADSILVTEIMATIQSIGLMCEILDD